MSKKSDHRRDKRAAAIEAADDKAVEVASAEVISELESLGFTLPYEDISYAFKHRIPVCFLGAEITPDNAGRAVNFWLENNPDVKAYPSIMVIHKEGSLILNKKGGVA